MADPRIKLRPKPALAGCLLAAWAWASPAQAELVIAENPAQEQKSQAPSTRTMVVETAPNTSTASAAQSEPARTPGPWKMLKGAANLTGAVRAQAASGATSRQGPLASAHEIDPDFASNARQASSQGLLAVDLKGEVSGVTASVTLSHQLAGVRPGPGLVLNELYGSGEWQGLHASLGKRVVGWDVGFGFRPNDLVQQEPRRTLWSVPLEGRPLAMVEGFGEDRAWAVALFSQRPLTLSSALMLQDLGSPPAEEAIAGRIYRHVGSADLYGFAKWGSRNRATLGGAFSWVASDALEVHGSARVTGRYTTSDVDRSAPTVARASPYFLTSKSAAPQVLAGWTWTSESKLSLLAEAWYDGTAPSDAFWKSWAAREDRLTASATITGPGGPAGVAGNLGWQAAQLSATPLRRTQVLLRAAWTWEVWQPSIDVLYTPADGGAVTTVGLVWQGDRVRFEGSARWFLGRHGALYSLMPTRGIAYGGMTIPF